MSHSYNKIWIHAIWATKNRNHYISHQIERKVYEFIYNQFKDLGCVVRIINGMPDHIHCLFLLCPNKSIAEVIKQVKGSSSHYVNQEKLILDNFSWQTGYASFSISESVMERVYQYIKNQKEHHRKKNFQDEYDGFLNLHGLSEK
ncbi:REP element-mobilizing transposase RayT [Pedobacter psychrotolerans]|uniref:Transposase n=1 Tax=Pedobacter psychrotolerans TaxID=1843235 RepID=A0A4R2HG06_9SPHI|nr:IS200/IS605 family transposase [Pedobacter psychrotolerans]TCO26934.1 REP element-mobilizing transposase RayT [Pedobacter psychrotolerans]GGE57639.1 transposase [Pedobacter psychrotolerans]